MFYGICIALCVGALAALGLWFEASCRRRRRQWFLSGHATISDDEFVAGLACSKADASICLIIRRAIAGMSDIPPESMAPSDPIQSLWQLQFDGGDPLELFFRLERELGIRIPNEWWEKHVISDPALADVACSFGVFAVRLARELRADFLESRPGAPSHA